MSTIPQLEQLPPAAISFSEKPRMPVNFMDWTRVCLSKAVGGFSWILQRAKAQQARKTLRVCESVSLGDKRFVAVIQAGDERFLIGGASGSVAMLTRLQEPKTFAETLHRVREGGNV